MSESKFTPGPWSVLHQTNVSTPRADGRSDRMVANCAAYSDGSADDGGFAESVANGRLIAAAPDLLAALNRAHSFILCNGYDAQDQAPLNEISAAIAKATGNAQKDE